MRCLAVVPHPSKATLLTIRDFRIPEQKVVYIASAPLSASGHVNVSPKGGQYFGIVDERTFWYMDLTGSGIETTSHLNEPGNGRITVMFNAFEGPPKIVRLWGKGMLSSEQAIRGSG